MPAINSRGQDQGVEEIYQITIKKNDSGLLILIEIYDFIYMLYNFYWDILYKKIRFLCIWLCVLTIGDLFWMHFINIFTTICFKE